MTTERYNRQVILTDFGKEGQKKLLQAKVLIIGAGGLGVPVLTYLNAMGVGTLGIVENDLVSHTNLHRQVLYTENDIGKPKLSAALERLTEQNSQTKIIPYHTYLTKTNALEIIADYDLVIDASDNFPTRYLVNDACVILKKSFIYGALHGFEGQISVFNYRKGPTYRCLFPTMPKSDEIPNCNENGVLGIVPGIVGSLQALEAVKVLTGVGEVLSGKLLLFDGLSNSFQKIRFSANALNLNILKLQDSYDFDCDVVSTSVEAEILEQLMEAERIQLIDVRSEKEFRRRHLAIAKNIPLSDLESRTHEIDFGSKAYFICQSGVRSKKAIKSLQDLRPSATLINVTGGMNQITKYVIKH